MPNFAFLFSILFPVFWYLLIIFNCLWYENVANICHIFYWYYFQYYFLTLDPAALGMSNLAFLSLKYGREKQIFAEVWIQLIIICTTIFLYSTRHSFVFNFILAFNNAPSSLSNIVCITLNWRIQKDKNIYHLVVHESGF